MKAVMISIRTPHSNNIFDGIKKIEWRTKPLPLCKHFVYEPKNGGGCGKVIGEMEIVESWKIYIDSTIPDDFLAKGCVPLEFLDDYGKIDKEIFAKYGIERKYLYANIISNPKLYDKPKLINEFWVKGTEEGWVKVLTRPPQSWQYVKI